jgi:hypothetical protein
VFKELCHDDISSLFKDIKIIKYMEILVEITFGDVKNLFRGMQFF